MDGSLKAAGQGQHQGRPHARQPPTAPRTQTVVQGKPQHLSDGSTMTLKSINTTRMRFPELPVLSSTGTTAFKIHRSKHPSPLFCSSSVIDTYLLRVHLKRKTQLLDKAQNMEIFVWGNTYICSWGVKLFFLKYIFG